MTVTADGTGGPVARIMTVRADRCKAEVGA